jgi:ferredoxin-NADP reductase
MMQWIDDLLNRITMYRLVLYYLLGLLAAAEFFCVMGWLPYHPLALLGTTVFLMAVCWLTNTLFAKTFRVPTNVESVYISALILALIITPLSAVPDLWFLGWAAVLAMASKYILAVQRKHLFNPIAFAVVLTTFTINETATWWVGSAALLPFVLLGGLLIVRKTQRASLVIGFLLTSLLTTLGLSILARTGLVAALQNTLLYSPWLFFAFVILTEPLTMPSTRRLQIMYGVLVGVLFAPQVHIGSVYSTPELAILIGNVFAYLVSPKMRWVLTLKEKLQIAPDIYDFIFVPSQPLTFAPGQYMEWTLGHARPDSRGNRRYFTLASAPTETHLRLGIKFYRESSTFKQALLAMDEHSEIVASQLAGDFVLPADPQQQCVLLAGGIGITPFRSMIQQLLDTNQKRPLTLFYVNRTMDDLVYQEVFDRAAWQLGVKTIYALTDTSNVPPVWRGKVGRITSQMIIDEVPDYQACLFYLSGPNAMVESFEDLLASLGVKRSHIKTDFFPGFV